MLKKKVDVTHYHYITMGVQGFNGTAYMGQVVESKGFAPIADVIKAAKDAGATSVTIFNSVEISKEDAELIILDLEKDLVAKEKASQFVTDHIKGKPNGQ